MNTNGAPSAALEELRDMVRNLPDSDGEAMARAREREATLVKPPGALGRLERIAEWLAGWQGRHPPAVERAMVAIFAGNHGVADRRVSPYPPVVTAQMVENFRNGGAAINQICAAQGFGLKIFELALEMPTGDITLGPAMSESETLQTILYGMEAVAGEVDLLCLGDMGIANTTIAAAVAHALYGGEARDWAGPGTGLDAAGIAHKADMVERAVTLHRDALHDPLLVLQRLGGREFAGICGAIIGARMKRVPVILDGYVTTAAAAILHALSPAALDHCLCGHLSAEPGHGRLLARLQMEPLLSLDMRLGEGTGAALAAGIVKAAAAHHAGMATFAEAGVSGSQP